MRSLRARDPVGQFVAERVPVVEKATFLRDQPARVGSRSARHPAKRSLTGQLCEGVNGLANVFALGPIVDVAIIDPAVAVTDHLMAALDAGTGEGRVLLHGPRIPQN